MKISYRTHPILEIIDKEDLSLLSIYNSDLPFVSANFNDIKDLWCQHIKEFKKDILFITSPFMDAAQKAYRNLLNLYSSLSEDGIEFELSGITFPMGRGNLTARFISSKMKKNGESENVMFGMNNEGALVYFFSDNINHKLNGKGWVTQSLKGNVRNIFVDTEKGRIEFLQREFIDSVIILMFKNYAEVETKYLAAGQKVKAVECNYKNETKSPVTILDSKWFTNLVKSDGFNVRGHFRLQPKKKEGEWTKELIWINEFEKHGYTAPARKLKEISVIN